MSRIVGTCQRAGCGKEIKWWPSRPKKFCSRRCMYLAQSGPGHPHWNGGRKIGGGGYVLIRLYGGQLIPEHRIVMEEALGRPLKPEERVHHRNGEKTDNRRENLVVFDTAGQHAAFHGIKGWRERKRFRAPGQGADRPVWTEEERRRRLGRVEETSRQSHAGDRTSAISA